VNSNFPAELAAHLAEGVSVARRRYRKRLERCQKKFSEKAVHDLRIETRRILALLSLLEALHFGGRLKKLRKTFKKRLEAFGDLRDTHVQMALLKPVWPAFPEARDFKKYLSNSEKRLVSELSREIETTKSKRLNRRLREIDKSLRKCKKGRTTRPSGGLAQMLLGGAFRRVVILRREVRPDNPATIHRMRIAFKRFRYTAELLQPFLPNFTPQRLGRMKGFQAAAGDIQDLAVLLARIGKLVKSRELSADCVKNLRGELLRQEHRAIDSFMATIDDLMEFEPEHSLLFVPELQTVSK
jgi:CHAD domain-containing protein